MRDYKGFKVPTDLKEIVDYTIEKHPVVPHLYWEVEEYGNIRLDNTLEEVATADAEREHKIFEYSLKSIERFIDDRLRYRRQIDMMMC